jgi:ABC-2 type transport system permease protein
MRNTFLIAGREFRERIGTRSFILVSFLGPVILLALVYMLFAYGGEGKQRWNVLITDPGALLSNHIVLNENASLHYEFVNRYVEIEEFRDKPEFQRYDAMVEINEKILTNKVSFVFFREKPATSTKARLQYEIEKRVEEVMIQELTNFPVDKYRSIKQALNMKFRDVYDPKDEQSDLRGWVGLFFGAVIFVFIFLFGMTILRSVSAEKTNRIAEVLLGAVKPGELMTGKILGIGLTALLQFVIWTTVIAAGLYVMRETFFMNMTDPSKIDYVQLSQQFKNKSDLDQMLQGMEYNKFVELVYERIQFSTMIGFFLLFFVLGYLFYGAFFAAVGAASGSESDGQQFVIPIILLLCFALYAGYFTMVKPSSGMADLFHYLPFTSPVVVMVKLGQGYPEGQGYLIFVAMLVLIVSTVIMLILAGRLYQNGILRYGHRLRLSQLFKWLNKP